jgi:hypothetical protein
MDQPREELIAAYDTTVVVALDPVGGWVDPATVAVSTGRSGVVMTAWNPGHERPSEAQNRAANAALGAELGATGLPVWRADGCAPDGSSPEEGWIIWAMPVEQGLDIAARYGQFAIYHYDVAGRRTTVRCVT